MRVRGGFKGFRVQEVRVYALGSMVLGFRAFGSAVPGLLKPYVTVSVSILSQCCKTSECFFVRHMGGCQNSGPFLGTLNNRCRIIMGTQKGTIILTTTHIC